MGYLDRKCRSANMRLHLGSALAFAALLFGVMSGSSRGRQTSLMVIPRW